MRFYFILVVVAKPKNMDRPNYGDDGKKWKPPYFNDRSIKWYSHFGKQFGIQSMLNIEILYDQTLLFLGT